MIWGDDSMGNNTSGTVKEVFLQNELDRIRTTYSFRLGLLLTDSIIRRPWMIIFLPFSFISMNINYIRDRRKRKFSGEDKTSLAHSNCLMLITASEEGVSASERTISIAKAWLQNKDHKVAIVSTNENLTSMTIQGVSHYQIPDPKTHRDISTSEWNETCANVVRGAIETHIPFALIFDGTYPYRGILNALSISPHQKKIWLLSERIEDEVIQRANGFFDSMITQDELTENLILANHPISSEEQIRTPSDNILVATGYGRHHQRDKMNKIINKRLANELNHTFIFPKNADSGSISKENVDFWESLVSHSDFPHLKAAIISDDYNLASTCCNNGIPTICLVNETTPTIILKKLNNIANLGNLFIVDQTDSLEINLYLNAFFDSSWLDKISQRKTVEVNSSWQQLFDICMT